MSAPGSPSADVADAVRAELRKERVRLWEPPYSPDPARSSGTPSSCAGNDVDSVASALSSLATTYAARLKKDNAAVFAALEELRHHAIEKLRAKTRVTLLGKVVAVGSSKHEFRVEVDAADTGGQVVDMLRSRLGPLCPPSCRLKAIAGGRCLQDSLASLHEQGWSCDLDRGGKPLRVLFIVSGGEGGNRGGNSSTSIDPAAADNVNIGIATDPILFSQTASSTTSTLEHQRSSDVAPPAVAATAVASQPLPPACPVATIREAAVRLTAHGFGDFELSDAATGRLVPVPAGSRQALVSAIALHARGKEILHGGTADAAVRALEFLVEADQCFVRCREGGAGQLLEKLSNYGELQLDICWAYALVGDADHLPDAMLRLDAAERMIGRQVDRNFLTLAEVKADQGLTLPPEVVPSTRLWLLRGIAKKFNGDILGARADLERAAVFLQGLRVNEVAIDSLLVLGATRTQAVAALRRSEGQPDRAAADLLAAAPQREAAQRERQEQQKLGQTRNGSFVDPDKVGQLEGMNIKRKVAIEALKMSNNDLNDALNAVQSMSEDALLGRGTKRERSEASAPAEDATPVDDLALASVLSLGFDREATESALRAAGNSVEQAVAILTAQIEGIPAQPTVAAEIPAIDEEEARKATDAEKVHKRERAEEDERKKKAAEEAEENKRAEEDAAREVVERELGRCLRRGDLDDEVAGATLEDEETLLQQHLSGL
eukprot:TRINITY_DN37922_c0_g1_i1.p1 TRINITY_DN37922_c0_g1~~TRINITY_DN37922_c0_g1_i1.p1  ORF type:complete len:720 (-),score=166.96 TRINITY_DN37922_c0_g1_i1:166-2325(-)